jgi:hypothetical protein
MVNRSGQPIEEVLQRCCVSGVKRTGAPRVDLPGRSIQPLGIASHEDDLGALCTGTPGGLQPDAGATADQNDGLAEQFRLAGSGNSDGFGTHDFSSR